MNNNIFLYSFDDINIRKQRKCTFENRASNTVFLQLSNYKLLIKEFKYFENVHACPDKLSFEHQ